MSCFVSNSEGIEGIDGINGINSILLFNYYIREKRTELIKIQIKDILSTIGY